LPDHIHVTVAQHHNMPLLRKIEWHKHQVSGGQWFLLIQKCVEVIDFGADRCFAFLGVIFPD
jgi:hypothetical protein